MVEITWDDWVKEAKKRYGKFEDIVFKCPVCGFRQKVSDCIEAGMSEGEIGFSCIGRHTKKQKRAFGDSHPYGNGPCDYAGGGLFRLNPIRIVKFGHVADYFDFADEPLEPKTTGK